MIKKFISLTKPGIIGGNLITLISGFFLAEHQQINYWLLLMTCLGISCIIASGCVFNNCIDRDIDRLMQRTKNRVLARGELSVTRAIYFAIILALIGSITLYTQTNLLTLLIALFGLFIYVVIYSLYLKRHSVYGTIIGSISGSIPPVAGYCAVSNRFDLGALLLFLMLSFWQMPHSYAIAIYRLNDYQTAHIPVLPAHSGINTTKVHMLAFIAAFIVITLLLTLSGYTGYVFFTIALLLGLLWLGFAVDGITIRSNDVLPLAWARKMFLFSIIVIVALSVTMICDVVK